MNGNLIKTTFKDQEFLEIHIWDSSLSHYFIIILLIAFIMPPFVIPVQFNIIVCSYYLIVISVSFNRYSLWSSSNQKIVFDCKKNQIKVAGEKSRTETNLFPLSQIQKIDFLINDHEDENLDFLIQNYPLENRMIKIHFQFINDFSFYFIAKNATTVYEWFELRNTIHTFISQIN